MKNSDKPTCGDSGGTSKNTGEPCEKPAGWGTDFDTGKCKFHRGTSSDGESHKANDNAVKHGLHTSKETFLEHAEDHHKDAYYAIHESLCSDYELKHGRLPTHINKRLSEIALDMVKLDMADEYAAENAVDESKPLTEMRKEMTESGPWEREVVSKIEQIKTNINREDRLALKDMGIYNSPEKEMAEGVSDIAELWEEDLRS